MAEFNQQFDNFDQWVAKASSWLTRHPSYNDTEHGNKTGWRGHHFTAICFDTDGRICRMGKDFMRARDESRFPVRWVWPDQIAPAFLGIINGRIPSIPHTGESRHERDRDERNHVHPIR